VASRGLVPQQQPLLIVALIEQVAAFPAGIDDRLMSERYTGCARMVCSSSRGFAGGGIRATRTRRVGTSQP
jgi:hypothetical protein